MRHICGFNFGPQITLATSAIAARSIARVLQAVSASGRCRRVEPGARGPGGPPPAMGRVGRRDTCWCSGLPTSQGPRRAVCVQGWLSTRLPPPIRCLEANTGPLCPPLLPPLLRITSYRPRAHPAPSKETKHTAVCGSIVFDSGLFLNIPPTCCSSTSRN